MSLKRNPKVGRGEGGPRKRPDGIREKGVRVRGRKRFRMSPEGHPRKKEKGPRERPTNARGTWPNP